MMGGDITVESEPGVGRPSRSPAGGSGRTRRSRWRGCTGASARHHRGRDRRGRATVLVVDDDQTVRELIARFLEREGFDVVTASGGQEGLRLARELRPAAITLDVMMPDMDGWTVLAAIKGDPALAPIPVILMSIVDEKNRGYALGAADYLVKPVHRDKLRRVLRGICGSAAGRVLVIDDDDTVRARRALALDRRAGRSTEAENGRIALDALPRRAARCDHSGSDDAGDGRFRVPRPSAPAGRLAGYSGRRGHRRDLTEDDHAA